MTNILRKLQKRTEENNNILMLTVYYFPVRRFPTCTVTSQWVSFQDLKLVTRHTNGKHRGTPNHPQASPTVSELKYRLRGTVQLTYLWSDLILLSGCRGCSHYFSLARHTDMTHRAAMRWNPSTKTMVNNAEAYRLQCLYSSCGRAVAREANLVVLCC
jgi:hypothetical protein